MRSVVPLALVVAGACTESTPTPPGPGPGPGPDAGIADTGPPDSGLPAVAAEQEPEAVPIDAWLLGLVSGNSDPIAPQLERKTFEMPTEGQDANGIQWRPVEPGALGKIEGFGNALGYAAFRLVEAAPRRLIARTSNAYGIYVGGVRQPGHVYGSRQMRVPFSTRAGDNVVVVRAHGGRGAPQVELFTTTDELFMNLADRTVPDFPVGESSTQYVGVAVLNFLEAPVTNLVARVVGSDHFEETTLAYPSIPAGATTQIGFELSPKTPFAEAHQAVPVELRLESFGMSASYTRTIELTTVTATHAYRRTFRSPIDHSIQYYGVVPPEDFDPARQYALILSLHGAGVEGIGQARSYSRKDWAYVIAPTNRRPFGFDWEEWGRLNGLAALDDATARFSIDPTRVYLTGHSMGGHGTWHVGVTTPGRFAVIAPSAGWRSFQSYGGSAPASGPFGRARAHSETLDYLRNLARRGIYILHGSADDNVPVREGRDMFNHARAVTSDIVYHEQPGAGHWWDGDASPGTDCVDWTPLIEFMQTRAFDPHELVFTFKSPSPSYSPTHSFVTLHAAETPNLDLSVTATRAGTTAILYTDNVRTLSVDGAALLAKGIDTVSVDGVEQTVVDGPMAFGAEAAKHAGVHGPFNQAFRRPFCYVYATDVPAYAEYAAYLTSYWALVGNGHACALPLDALTDDIRRDYNLIFLGVPEAAVGDTPFDWNELGPSIGGRTYERSAALFVRPNGDRLSAAMVAARDAEHLLFRYVPFSSRSGMPDFLVWSEGGGEAAGFFDADWAYDPSLAVP